MRMALVDVADILADILGFEDVYAGNIDGNLERCIGVYNGKTSDNYKICIGGKPCTKTLEKKISILVHWTQNPTLCEKQSELILDRLTDIHGYKNKDYTVRFISCKEPVDVGKDERGFCEYVIEATMYYERNE